MKGLERILVTGGTGLLGTALVRRLSKEYEVYNICLCGGSNERSFGVNICDYNLLKKTIDKIKPDAVVHTAALTNVDYCENHKEEAFNVNVIGTKNVVECSKDAKLVHLSTDYIFDGKSGPYDENANPNPLNYYGRTKLESEEYVKKHPNSIIVRTTVLYGNHKKEDFVCWVLNNLKQEKKIKVFNGQYGNPTYNNYLAAGIEHLIEGDKTGIINIVGREHLSRYDFAARIAKSFGYNDELIEKMDNIEQRAERPEKGGLVINKLMSSGFIMPSLDDALDDLWMEKNNIIAISRDKVSTMDKNGNINGYIIELVSNRDNILDNNDFGQVYLTVAYPGCVKGWHVHKEKTGHFNVIKGDIKLVLTDGRKFREFLIGDNGRFLTVKVPSGIKAAFKSIGNEPAYVINYSYPDFKPGSDEMTTEDIKYRW